MKYSINKMLFSKGQAQENDGTPLELLDKEFGILD